MKEREAKEAADAKDANHPDAAHRKLLEGLAGRVGMWQEDHNGHTDVKDWGPSSIGLDVHFPGEQRILLQFD